MATQKQIAANRRNAQKSTGPKSPEAKAKVSQNRTVHGLCRKFCVLQGVESQEEYEAFLNQLTEDEQPVGQAEIELVVKMAEHTWLSKRALHMQEKCFVAEPTTPEDTAEFGVPIGVEPHLERWVRYQTTNDRAYQRASAELQRRRKERRLAEIGFESQKRAEAEQARKAEKHAVTIAVAKMRKQREEIKLGTEIADALPPNFDLSSLDKLFSTAARSATPRRNGRATPSPAVAA